MDTCNSIRRARPLLGTLVEIAAADAARPAMESAIEAAFAAVAQVHRLMSFHDPDSDVSRVNRDAGLRTVAVHPWTYHVIETALELHRGSSGAFDIAVAPVLQNLAVLPRTGNDTQPISVAASTAETIELLAGHCVRFRHRRAAIDLGGIAKGFAVDRAIAVLCGCGVTRGLVNAGGDLAAFGRLSETVHIRDPRDPSRLLCHVEIANAALASSGRPFDPLRSIDTQGSAVIDPLTQAPVCDIAGASVLAPSCMIADALTKIVMIAGENATDLLARHKASALLVLKSGEIRVTPDWQHAVRLAA
jgi:thiamine biosynthesis lipoprotein